ncbi:hypothetical protein L208DRAFT_811343 [Tricholoma matsutake]|nr:hypothetical protein L208DRAFT_811343 [Tricholoma matsutake 945]
MSFQLPLVICAQCSGCCVSFPHYDDISLTCFVMYSPMARESLCHFLLLLLLRLGCIFFSLIGRSLLIYSCACSF